MALKTHGIPMRSRKSTTLSTSRRLKQPVLSSKAVPSGSPDTGSEWRLQAGEVGIRVRMRTMERAAFYTAWREKKLRGIFVAADGSAGNAATRVESFMYSKGTYAYGGYPDIDELFQQQRQERDRAKREAILHHIQQLTVERVMFAPIMDLRGLIGVGPRVAEHTINSIPLHPGPAFQNIQLKGQ